MKDFYLNTENTRNRLLKEWRTHGKLVIAYDFDNTVYDFHDEGHTYSQVIELIRRCKRLGAHLIVFTASREERYEKIKSYLNKHDIPFDSINEDPSFITLTTRKIYYNILLDDRAGLESAYNDLLYAVNKLEQEQINNG